MKKLLLLALVVLVMTVGCLSSGDSSQPVVDSLDVSPGSINPGESSTLSWSVSQSATVSIDQGIGDVALSGSRVVSPVTTTTYTLTATNDAGSVTVTAQVVVNSSSESEPETEPPVASEHTVTLHSIPAEDGNVRDGAPGPYTDDPVVGDDEHNRARQVFLSFDISGIPSSATIKLAALDVSGGNTGMPFPSLGKLRVYNDQYGTIDAGDFTSGFPGGEMKTYSFPHSPISGPFTNPILINKVQTRVNAGDSRFQVRLQFEKQTNWNGNRDTHNIGASKLVITYED